MKQNQLFLNKFGRVVVHTTSSTTRLIEILFNVKLKVQLLNQQEMTECPDFIRKHLNVKPSPPVLREICLVDTESRPFIYAMTLFYKDDLHPDIIDDLYSTDIPIGKIIEKNKLEIYREVLDHGIIQDSNITRHLGLKHNEHLLYKVSSMRHQGKTMFLVCEFFPTESLNLSKSLKTVHL